MVNLTESFTKLYGRPPSESEIASMWKMKREQEGYRKQQAIKKTAVKTTKRAQEPRLPTQINEPKRKFPYRAPKVAHMINRMLIIQTRIDDIAYVLGISEAKVRNEIDYWELPSERT